MFGPAGCLMAVPQSYIRLVWIGTFVLALIGIAAGMRRLVVLAQDPGTGFTANLDTGFARHPILTVFHILPGILFMILGPLQFSQKIRRTTQRTHRWIGRVFLTLSVVIGFSALAMSFQMAIGGINEMAATVLFDLLFLFCLIQGYRSARRRDFVHHREWMIRTFGIGLGIATTRPVMGVFFATSRITHLTPHDFFGIAFWIGFSVTLVAAESWVNYTRPDRRVA